MWAGEEDVVLIIYLLQRAVVSPLLPETLTAAA
jgi:hypothetical protein